MLDQSENCESDEHEKHSETQTQSSSLAAGGSHAVMTTSSVPYVTPQFGAGHAMVILLSLNQNL